MSSIRSFSFPCAAREGVEGRRGGALDRHLTRKDRSLPPRRRGNAIISSQLLRFTMRALACMIRSVVVESFDEDGIQILTERATAVSEGQNRVGIAVGRQREHRDFGHAAVAGVPGPAFVAGQLPANTVRPNSRDRGCEQHRRRREVALPALFGTTGDKR